MKRFALPTVICFALLLPASAIARPSLSLDKAQAAVVHAVAIDVRVDNEAPSFTNEPSLQAEVSVLDSWVYLCDRETDYRALCDYTYDWSDGTSCDYTATVVESNPTGRHEHIRTRLSSDDETDTSEEEDCYPTEVG